jgi:hypothetical protein
MVRNQKYIYCRKNVRYQSRKVNKNRFYRQLWSIIDHKKLNTATLIIKYVLLENVKCIVILKYKKLFLILIFCISKNFTDFLSKFIHIYHLNLFILFISLINRKFFSNFDRNYVTFT